MKLNKTTIIVKELVLNNKNLQGQFQLQHKINMKYAKIGDNLWTTELHFELTEDSEHPRPIDLAVTIMGQFEFEEITINDNIPEFLSKSAVHILYPYLRSTISGLTSIAMLPPVVIPIVDAYNLFKDKLN